jgi:hypothetical protein
MKKLEFMRALDKIALYVVQGEEHSMSYSEKLLSEMSGIPIETVKNATAKLSNEGYVTVAKAGGNNGLTLFATNKLKALVAESSFEDEYEEGKMIGKTNFINAPNNQGILLQDSFLLGDDNAINQKVTATPSKKNKAYKAKSWYDKPLFKYIFWPVVVGLIILIIGYVITNNS